VLISKGANTNLSPEKDGIKRIPIRQAGTVRFWKYYEYDSKQWQ